MENKSDSNSNPRQQHRRLPCPGVSRPALSIGSPAWAAMTDAEIDAVLAARIDAYEAHILRQGHRPKREGYVTERIASIDNLRAADIRAQSGKVRINRHIRRHNARAEADLRALQRMILTMSFPPPGYRSETIVTDAGKTREIVKRDFYPWRILDHAMMLVVMPVMLRHLVYDSVACVKGKGLHFGVKRMKRMLRLNPGHRWFWKCDYKKYYQSLPHTAIEGAFRERIKDENFFTLMRLALFTYSSGPDIDKTIEDEETRKQRHANWLVREPAHRGLRRQRH